MAQLFVRNQEEISPLPFLTVSETVDPNQAEIFIQGKYDDVTQKFKYDDGTLFVYENWNVDEQEPDNDPRFPYVIIRPDKGFLWHSYYLNTESNYICEIYM